MTLDGKVVAKLAEQLENAELNRAPITKITDEYPDLDWDDAYEIQDELRRRKTNSGARIAGLKAGLTSQAKMKQMNVREPVFGFMCDYGACADGGEIEFDRFIAPRVEAEIAFVTKREIAGPCHIGTVLAATDFVLPAVEILDSRYENFKFDLISVVADNTSAAAFVSGGNPRRIQDVDLRTLGIVLEKNGEIVDLAAGAAVLGQPAESVVMLANMLARKDQVIPSGTFIMTGGVTAAIGVERGDHIAVRYQDLGSVSMRFV
ncbi:MAG TPA: 2-oxo-3-hexenedioate decarboxylase [Gammaproteobacteria bacterium]|nr:2-oxo-3-hexenedioate decarboxylase [Gammaproteobacteria bacterium]|tara:strand:- start:1221 stop:2006 length:786 start_codon:yes stop_codon:yes gene_type:complete